MSSSVKLLRSLTEKQMLKPAPGLNSPVLAEGSSCPVYDGKQIRLYNMRFCPYGQRALIALGIKEIPFEVVNVHLKSKPDWFLAKNPLGKVPTFDLPDGTVIYESGVCVEYLEEMYPNKGQPLLPKDPFDRACEKMKTELITSKLLGPMYGMLLRGEDTVKIREGLKYCESMLGSSYFGGAKPSYSDYMMWPFFERIHAISAAHKEDFNINEFTKFSAYLKRMMEIPAIRIYARSVDEHQGFFKSFKEGNIDYDFGIVERSKQ